jgi:carboxyl-terminal processing protease
LDPKKYNAFKTKGGRTVYDGGGILPDIEIEAAKFSPITTALLRENTIFNYATQYRYKNKLGRWEDFTFTDKDFQGFLKYLKNNGFDFETQTELSFKKALRKADDDGLKKQIQSNFEKLMSSIKEAKKKKISDKKEEIIALLKAEILKQYFYSSGLYAYQVINSPEIRAAVEVLNNEGKYQRILK